MKALTRVLAATLLLSAVPAAYATTLTVTNDAAFTGNFGMKVTLDAPIQNAFVQDDTPNAETVYRASFKVRQLTTMANSSAHNVFRARMPGTPIFQVQLARQSNGDYILWALVFTDAGTIAGSGSVFIPTQAAVTVEWQAASAPGANDGVFRLFKGANLRAEFTNIDNDTHAIDQVQMGSFGGIDATSSGEIHFDDFESFRTLSP